MAFSATASAPGKLILFGEHAVVYGHTAVAVALSNMRVAVHVALRPCQPAGDAAQPTEVLEVTLHDLPSASGRNAAPVRACVSLDAIASSAASLHAAADGDPDSWRVPRSADAATVEAFGSILGDAPADDKAALVPLLFLVASLLPQLGALDGPRVGGRLEISVRSAGLPVGAGLGSSAAFSVALAAALLRLQLQLQRVSTAASSGGISADGVARLVASSPAASVALMSGAAAAASLEPGAPAKELINGWAYRAECILHGTPSGLDNAVSCAGGGMRLSKQQQGERASGGGVLTFSAVGMMPDLTVLVTNTRVPRSTRDLVARVRALHEAHPAITEPLFAAVAAVGQTFLDMLGQQQPGNADGGAPRSLSSELPMLVRANHGLLVSLGVSGPALEDVVATAAAEGLATKLTGAGGGGCALSVVAVGQVSAAAARAAARAKRRLEAKGYVCHLARVGGAGVLWHTPEGDSPLAGARGRRAVVAMLPAVGAAAAAVALLAVGRAWRK